MSSNTTIRYLAAPPTGEATIAPNKAGMILLRLGLGMGPNLYGCPAGVARVCEDYHDERARGLLVEGPTFSQAWGTVNRLQAEWRREGVEEKYIPPVEFGDRGDAQWGWRGGGRFVRLRVILEGGTFDKVALSWDSGTGEPSRFIGALLALAGIEFEGVPVAEGVGWSGPRGRVPADEAAYHLPEPGISTPTPPDGLDALSKAVEAEANHAAALVAAIERDAPLLLKALEQARVLGPWQQSCGWPYRVSLAGVAFHPRWVDMESDLVWDPSAPIKVVGRYRETIPGREEVPVAGPGPWDGLPSPREEELPAMRAAADAWFVAQGWALLSRPTRNPTKGGFRLGEFIHEALFG